MSHGRTSSISGTFPSLDSEIAALAAEQGGYVTRQQLLGRGLKRGAIARRTDAGRLIAVYQGVYAVGHLPKLPQDRARAALLAMGDRAALDGWSAAALWGAAKLWPARVEVVSPVDRRPQGIKVRLCTRLERGDIRTVDGLRVTSPALTVLQVAPSVNKDQLTRMIDTLRLQRNLTIVKLDAALQRFPRAQGAASLRAIIPLLQDEPTRSGLERRWPPFAAKYNLPPYVMNKHVLKYRVDVRFLPDRLIVELDGPQHAHPWAVRADKKQDREIFDELGIPTLRITDHEFDSKPAEQAKRILQALARRPD